MKHTNTHTHNLFRSAVVDRLLLLIADMEQYFVSTPIYRFRENGRGGAVEDIYIFICIYDESGSKVLADARKGRRTAVADANGGEV